MRGQPRARTVARVALLASCGALLQLVELPLPRPVPWAKPGFANLATLAALHAGTVGEALVVLLLRVLLASLLSGTFLTPSFALSLAGGLAAWAAMAALDRLFGLCPLSVCAGGGIAHNLGQLLAVARLVGHAGVLPLMPALLVSGLLAGLITGFAGSGLLRRLPSAAAARPPERDPRWTSTRCA